MTDKWYVLLSDLKDGDVEKLIDATEGNACIAEDEDCFGELEGIANFWYSSGCEDDFAGSMCLTRNQALEKMGIDMTRKTIEDALDAFPDGWPVEYGIEFIGIGWDDVHEKLVPYMRNSLIDHSAGGHYKICTREEFESAHKARKEKEMSKWIPEVGVECEYNCPQLNGDEWHTGRVVAKDGKMWVLATDENDQNQSAYNGFPLTCLRPIKSNRDKWVDKCLSVIVDLNACTILEEKGARMFASRFYDAIVSGKLEVPEVEKC